MDIGSAGPISLEALVQSLSEQHEGEPGPARWINGRQLAVLGAPVLGNTTDIAYGVSRVPAGQSTPTHSHRAEELALVLDGEGVIEIEGVAHTVRAGELLRTPPHAVHTTTAGRASALTVLWVYAPPGSEDRLFADEVEES